LNDCKLRTQGKKISPRSTRRNTKKERGKAVEENKNSTDKQYSLNVIIPFFYEKTYIELFNELLEGKIKIISSEENIYNEEYIETFLKINDTIKRFLSEFIPNIPKNCYLKTNKIKYKSKSKRKNK